MDKGERDRIALELLPYLLEEYDGEEAVDEAFDLAEYFLAKSEGGQSVHAAKVAPGSFVYHEKQWKQVLEDILCMGTDPAIVWFEGKDAPTAAMVDAWGGDGEGVPD
jgi:hypothetical protein